MGTNCLGPFLLNNLLEPILKSTAATSEPDTVRIVWLGSLVNIGTHAGGIVWDEKKGGPTVLKNAMENYMQTKVGNIFLAHEAAERLSSDGVLSFVSLLWWLGCSILS
jgi:retinol dehydrogenase 12